MIYKKESDLNLLPINLQMFAPGTVGYIYWTNITGTYLIGAFPTSRYINITTTCTGGTCPLMFEGSSYTFQGISTSSSEFLTPNSDASYAFNSTIADTGNLNYPYLASYTLTAAQTNLINLLSVGTYYVWYAGISRGTLVISPTDFSGTVTVTKDFVTTNKLLNNPIITSLTWTNPGTTTLYHYYSLSSSANASSGADTVHGWYGPYTCTGSTSVPQTINTSIQYENVGTLLDNTNLYLSSYITNYSTWNAKTSGFNTLIASRRYRSDMVKVRDVYFTFSNPVVANKNAKWNEGVTFPNYSGYNLINWSDTRLGMVTYRNDTVVNTNSYNLGVSINGTTNNKYWYDMTGTNSTKNNYTITYRSALPINSGLNWINGSLASPYQINLSSAQSFTIPFPTDHLNGATQYSEYTFNRFTISRDAGNGGTLPTMSSNTLSIPISSYGNVFIDAIWDHAKVGNTGNMYGKNSGSIMDINGYTRSFNGYTYNFYNSTAPTIPITTGIPYTSNANPTPKTGIFEAVSQPGYEFLSGSILAYPFTSDGSISASPYTNVFSFYQNTFSSSLPAPLFGNSGTVKYNYSISGLISGDINVGIATQPFEHPIYVSLGSNITSFTYNGQTYNSLWPNTYVYDTKTYYKLAGATFNVLGTYSYSLTNIGTTAGFYAPNHTISISNSTPPWTNSNILLNAFVNLSAATLIQYPINITRGTGLTDIEITNTSYNILTPTFTPAINFAPAEFGYNNLDLVISGTITNNGLPVQSGLTSIVQIINPSYNNYDYTVSANKQSYFINKNITTPYGISSYTLSKNNYEISTSKQEVTISYTMNDGYAMNTSNVVGVASFRNIAGTTFTGADQTWNKFNIPASTIDNVIVTIPAFTPEPIKYNINSASILAINGINTFTITPNNYYISNSATKQTITTSIGLKDGYAQPTGVLSTAGSLTSEHTNTIFKINTNGYGDITVTPAAPIKTQYDVTITPTSIPGSATSGISAVTITPITYNVESLTFTPAITSITYLNSGFSGETNNITSIPTGSYGHKSFGVYATPVVFNINITKDAGISTYEYGVIPTTYAINSRIDTYNVLQATKTIILNNIAVTNKLYSTIGTGLTIGTVPTGSTGHKSFALSSALKINSISIPTLPTGYASSALSDTSYTATNIATKTITLTHTMNPGYSQPTGSLTVSNIFNDSSDVTNSVSVTSISNRGFIIPLRSWGDIAIGLAPAGIINYQVAFPTSAPTGVNSVGFGVTPMNYMVSDSYAKTFTINILPLSGYEAPSWTLNTVPQTGFTFSMPSFNVTPPSISVYSGNIINYNMNIIKGDGIASFNYGSNYYTADATVDTYNVLSTKRIILTDIVVIDNTYKPVSDYIAISVYPGATGDKTNTVSAELKTETGVGWDSISYDATDNLPIDTTQMESVTGGYSRFKESLVCSVLVQNILPDAVFLTDLNTLNTKYVLNLLSDYIRFRKIVNKDVVKGYDQLTILSTNLNAYLNTPTNIDSDNMIVDTAELLSQIESGWTGANSTELSNISISRPCDLWTSSATSRLASADIFKIMFKVSDDTPNTYTYWIFDGLIDSANITNTLDLNADGPKSMFLLSTANGLKEIITITDKDDAILYDRSPMVIYNNEIIVNWEDAIPGQNKPADVYGFLHINKDKVYSMDIAVKTYWGPQPPIDWASAPTPYVTITLPYSPSIRLNEPPVPGSEVDSRVMSYSKIPIKDIYSSVIDNLSLLCLADVSVYTIDNDVLDVTNLDNVLGANANLNGALSSGGSFYVPTWYYKLWINNTKSSSLRTASLTPNNIDDENALEFVYPPDASYNRNIGTYIVRGPVSNYYEIENIGYYDLRFLLNDSTDVSGVHIGKLDPNNLNTITELIPLTNEAGTNWYKLLDPFVTLSEVGKLTYSTDYYTIVIETTDRLMYNNLLVYKSFHPNP